MVVTTPTNIALFVENKDYSLLLKFSLLQRPASGYDCPSVRQNCNRVAEHGQSYNSPSTPKWLNYLMAISNEFVLYKFFVPHMMGGTSCATGDGIFAQRVLLSFCSVQ